MKESTLRQKLQRMPKAELHVHLDGSIRPSTLLELSRAEGLTLPSTDLDELTRYMVPPDGGSLEEYLERFEITLAVMQTEDALERITYELGEQFAAENVRYAEIRFSPILNTRGGLSLESVLEASLRGMRQAERDLDLRLGMIVCAIRSMPPDDSIRLAELAARYLGQGVVGFDLAGPEHGHPPARHKDAFAVARAANLGVTIHAGEAYGPKSIHEAVHLCGAHRIGHGTRLHEDPELLAYVRDFRVPLEACLTSNVQTGAASTLESHPLRRYFKAGLVVGLNTDNRLISGVSLTDEYLRAHQHLGFTLPELGRLAISGLEGAFLPWPEKVAMIDRFEQEIGEIVAAAQPVT